MAFTDAGPDTYLASGHPTIDERDKPINAGLLTSTDGGHTWQETALAGQVDFHALDHPTAAREASTRSPAGS
ncbi:hypothetical protein [Nocardioides abyssi]|uniref:Exo-alpha-sialidase n=1 Tax=Nocardioides abyssi TaxID=3058370 RepID=A0ABT8EUP0_9ACTN|nr:hypothetical protein [Nocardioides abyssi]MDN4161892.1 hypothetical protein [Nocardioides abyssi]